MPYILNELREELAPSLEELINQLKKTPMDDREGHANYVITKILCQLFDIEDGKVRYKYLNRAVGVLECAKQELYRRAAGPYEDAAIEKNGDMEEYLSFDRRIWQTAYRYLTQDLIILPEAFLTKEEAIDFLKYRKKYDGQYSLKTEYYLLSPAEKLEIYEE